MRIEEFSDAYTALVIELVTGILRDEFGFPVSAAQQPDLLDIEKHYGTGSGNFWLALEADQLVGTIGLLDLGSRQGALRKMFVRLDFRGTGAAQLLLDRLLSWARSHSFESLYLGTTAEFHAAHRFYEKHGFELTESESLPVGFPRFELHDRYYRRTLI